ncbi:hypothetical protein EF910_10540 [Streptomyces sp. WAC07149]|uniref:hypothetical protein n=1 Tax=Streptomyces sp. WAC07149 TaxID=2487425 RepID=UPI000F7A888B|nr:hypothetical protein [Streptomyces sp. WAC07149]RST06157.1 hypothetical protein EF910_10540 [Streptomyces sp. WAC07149]
MPTTLPVPIAFTLPAGWQPVPAFPDVAYAAVHPQPDSGFTANITVDGGLPKEDVTPAELADASVERLREFAASVVVTHRQELGSVDAPALAQRVTFSAVAGDGRRDFVQSQVYLFLPDGEDPRKRALVRLALTSTADQYESVLEDFQDFVRTVRPDGGAED